MKFSRLVTLLLVAVTLVRPVPVLAGDLDDFERGGRKKERQDRNSDKDSDHRYREKSHDYGESDARFLEGVFKLFAYLIVGSGAETHTFFVEEREQGDRVLPLARAEVSYQRVIEDIDGLNTRVELGYSAVGASFSFLQYWEHDPSDRQSQISGAFLYRLAGSRNFRFDVSLGGRTIRGSETLSGFEGGFLTGIYPTEHWGGEAEVLWTNIQDHALHDYRIGAVYMRHYWNIRAGWRWQHLADKTLHGPEFSVGTQW